MTNNEIRETIKEIIRIKALKERETILREKIFKELRKRRKNSLDLGGDDFVKVVNIDVKEYSPWDLFKQMCSTAFVTAKGIVTPDAVLSKDVKALCDVVSIAKGKVRERYNDSLFFEMKPVEIRTRTQLHYSVSVDQKNTMRGIDL